MLAEIDPATFNVDPDDVERKMSPRTRAMLPVHNNGLSADMDALLEIAEPAGYHHVWYGYTLLLDRPFAGQPRDKIVRRLASEYGITAWVMNASLGDYDTVLNRPGHTPEQTPISTDVGRRLLCPPLHPRMDDEDLRYIAAALKASIEAVAAEAGIVTAVA